MLFQPTRQITEGIRSVISKPKINGIRLLLELSLKVMVWYHNVKATKQQLQTDTAPVTHRRLPVWWYDGLMKKRNSQSSVRAKNKRPMIVIATRLRAVSFHSNGERISSYKPTQTHTQTDNT